MSALVIGLGNPGPEYAQTRHNIGQMVIAEIARAGGASLSANRKVNARVAQVRIGGVGPAGVSATVATPSSYMNVSGGPVSALAKYLSIEPTAVVVVHDELDIPFGTIKIKRGGGSGGHNGLKDITKALGTPDYVRVRMGIGRPPGRMDAATFVLKPFGAAERKELPMLISDGADAVESVIVDGLEAAQLRFHSK